MLRVARLLALVLLALGVVCAVVGVGWILIARGSLPTGEEVKAMSPLGRGFALVIHSRLGIPAAAALAVGAIGGGFLLWQALTRRWAFAAIAATAVVAIGVVWGARRVVARMEDPRYVDESGYVRAATQVASGGTVYFAALALAAGAAWFLSRRSGLPPPPAAPTISGGASG